MARVRHWLGWLTLIGGPPLALVLLLRHQAFDPTWMAPIFHFYVVSLTAMLTVGLAGLMTFAARQVKDARVFLLSLAFLGIAGVFLTHALTTPFALIQQTNPWVGFSAYLSLFAGATFLALGTIEWRPAASAFLMQRQGAILACFIALLLAFGSFALLNAAGQASANTTGTAGYGAGDYGEYGPAGNSTAMPGMTGMSATPQPAGQLSFLSAPAVSRGFAALTLFLLGLVIVRYALRYRANRSPLVAGFLATSILLAQAQCSMLVAPTWHASWWEYHLLMLAAFGAAIVSLRREYAQSGSWHGMVEGLLLRDTIAQLQRGYNDVIVALIAAVEAKDPYTRGHTQRVAALSLLVGQELRLPSERLRVLYQSALLHDIGKIGVPDAILNKPGRLTDEEFAIIREHPARGHAIIQGVRSLHDEIGGVRHHHERLDGSGYPDGLVGDAIPLDARIIAVADVFDALTSSRSYRAAWSREQALATIDADAGATLDACCVAALHSVLAGESSVVSRQSSELLASLTGD
ncbi:MAG: HD domain-containing phosphohydrolase [Thermomicrobiales bacterium]